MPRREVVEAEVVEAVLDVLGPYGLSKAKRIADQVTKTIVAHGWQVVTWAEFDAIEDLTPVSSAGVVTQGLDAIHAIS